MLYHSPKVRKPTVQDMHMAADWPLWEKEPSEFDWEYDDKETCYILEGKAKVTFQDGEVEFGEGDWVVFPNGLKCRWHITEKIVKHYKFGD